MFKVNKNLNHNGVAYKAGDEIAESASGFQELLKAGHVDKIEGAQVVKKSEVVLEPEAVLEPEQFSEVFEDVADEFPKKKKRK